MDRSDILSEDIQAFRNCRIDPICTLTMGTGVTLDLTDNDVTVYFTIRSTDDPDTIALSKNYIAGGDPGGITILTGASFQVTITESDWTNLPTGTLYRYDCKVISDTAGIADICVGGQFVVLPTQSQVTEP